MEQHSTTQRSFTKIFHEATNIIAIILSSTIHKRNKNARKIVKVHTVKGFSTL